MSRCTTAVATVPTTALVIVFVIANFVRFKVWQTTAVTFALRRSTFRVGLSRAVTTRALFAWHVVVRVFVTTTVSSIPIAGGVIIFAIAECVALPGGFFTLFFCKFFDARVTFFYNTTKWGRQALALFATIVRDVLRVVTTTISLIPGTPSIVVGFVAEAITHIVGQATYTLDLGSATIGFELESAV